MWTRWTRSLLQVSNKHYSRIITVALDMNEMFDSVNIHRLMNKLIHTIIADYIKERRTYTILQCQFNALKRRIFIHIPQHFRHSSTLLTHNSKTMQVTSESLQQREAYTQAHIQPYTYIHAWTKSNYLLLKTYWQQGSQSSQNYIHAPQLDQVGQTQENIKFNI